jgi:hypothetical protein
MTESLDLPVASTHSALPAALDVLTPPLLIRGEEVSSYDTLLARVSATVKPADTLEEIWVRDVVDLVWDAVRLRREKAALMNACAHEGLQKILSGLEVRDSFGLAARWAARDEATVARVDALLASAGLTMDAVMAQTLCVRLGEIERIDRLTMSAEARRNIALHELERHRAHFAALLRRAAQNAENEAEDIKDAEFEVVSPPTGQTPPGAMA